METPDGSLRHPIREGELSVGGAPGNDVVVAHPTVSRRHAVVRCQGGQMSIEDLGSRNGTFVNGVHVRRAAIEVGDQIHLGLGVLQVELDEPVADAGTCPIEAEPTAVVDSQAGIAVLPATWPPPTHPPAEVAVAWLDLLHGLVEVATTPGSLPRDRVLRALVEALGASGGALVEWRDDQPPDAVCTCGQDAGTVAAGALSAWFATSSPEAGGPSFLVLPPVGASPPLAGAWVALGDGLRVALVVSGDFAGRGQSGPQLASCARLLGTLGASP